MVVGRWAFFIGHAFIFTSSFPRYVGGSFSIWPSCKVIEKIKKGTLLNSLQYDTVRSTVVHNSAQ